MEIIKTNLSPIMLFLPCHPFFKINAFSNLSWFIELFFYLPSAAVEKPIGGQKDNISDHWIVSDKRIEILKVI